MLLFFLLTWYQLLNNMLLRLHVTNGQLASLLANYRLASLVANYRLASLVANSRLDQNLRSSVPGAMKLYENNGLRT